MLDSILFYTFAAITVAGAALTITRRSPVHSAIWLIVSLLGVAGLFLLQGAEFLFAAQIILYVGGIMVLFLFVIMLVNLEEAARHRQWNGQWALSLACVLAGAGVFGFAIRRGSNAVAWRTAVPISAGLGNTERVGQFLFQHDLLPFEIASILLLVAMVGSVLMAKKSA